MRQDRKLFCLNRETCVKIENFQSASNAEFFQCKTQNGNAFSQLIKFDWRMSSRFQSPLQRQSFSIPRERFCGLGMSLSLVSGVVFWVQRAWVPPHCANGRRGHQTDCFEDADEESAKKLIKLEHEKNMEQMSVGRKSSTMTRQLDSIARAKCRVPPCLECCNTTSPSPSSVRFPQSHFITRALQRRMSRQAINSVALVGFEARGSRVQVDNG